MYGGLMPAVHTELWRTEVRSTWDTKMAEVAKKIPGLKITTKIDGFRRAGREWVGTTKVAKADFTEDQLVQLLSEPNLTVQKTQVDA